MTQLRNLPRRRRSEELMVQVLAEGERPGASVTAVALTVCREPMALDKRSYRSGEMKKPRRTQHTWVKV